MALFFCFVLSSLSAIRNPEYQTNRFAKALAVFAWIMVFAWFAYQVSQSKDGQLGGFGIAEYIVFGSVMLFSAIADLRYLLKSGLSTVQKLIRHLWRMFFYIVHGHGSLFFRTGKVIFRNPTILRAVSYSSTFCFYFNDMLVGKSGDEKIGLSINGET